MKNNSISESDIFALCQSENKFPIDFELAWRWIGYSRKNNAKAALLSCGFNEGIDLLIEKHSMESEFGKPKERITLTVDCFKTWAMMAATQKGREVRKYFIECERKLKEIVSKNVIPADKELFLGDLLENDLGATLLQAYAEVYGNVAKEFGEVATIAGIPNYADIAKCLSRVSNLEMSAPPEFDEDLEESTPEVDLDNQRFALMVREAFATLDPVSAANWILELAKKDPDSIYLSNFPRSQNIPGYQRGSAELAAAKN